MISMLTGIAAEKNAGIVVIDVHGVGYGVLLITDDYSQVVIHDPVTVYIYEYIRENGHDLYGFLAKDTQQLFEQLLGVNGVGPKMALSLLSIGSTSSVREAIANGDTVYISGANGVGKRVAERVIVDLKDKVGLVSSDRATAGLLQSEDSANKDEAVAALMSLGYNLHDALAALQDVSAELPIEERIKLALKGH